VYLTVRPNVSAVKNSVTEYRVAPAIITTGKRGIGGGSNADTAIARNPHRSNLFIDLLNVLAPELFFERLLSSFAGQPVREEAR